MNTFTLAILSVALNLLVSLPLWAQYDVGTTAGTPDVSPNGAATYTIPVAVPPGVRDVAPSIALAYSSQTGNALAGWGWSISGLSAITRVGATHYHDDVADGVDFDALDRFSLDGERLMLTKGTYGRAQSAYTTESYANVKVVAFGTNKAGARFGPDYFRVYQPDGSFAQYENITEGSITARQAAEWVVTYTQDTQGNRINFNYYRSRDRSLVKIKSITYGGPRASRQDHPNEIRFVYRKRNQFEVGYLGGERFERSYILKAVEVLAQGERYRRYDLTHRLSSLGYDVLDQVQESNGAGDQLAPLKFSYGEAQPYNLASAQRNISVKQPVNKDTRALSGDFDADGRNDFVLYQDSEERRNFLDVSLQRDGYTKRVRTPVDPFVRAGTAVVREGEGKEDYMLPGQSIVTQQIDGRNYIFRGYRAGSTGKLKKLYQKTWRDPEGSDNPKEMILGNFTGDGTTRAVLVEHNNSEVYLANLGPRPANNFVAETGLMLKKYKAGTSFLRVADFDGDGQDDLWHFRDKFVNIYKFEAQKLKRIAYFASDLFVAGERDVYLGDYNGDGKTDLLVPEGEGSSTWHYFIARGNLEEPQWWGLGPVTLREITVEMPGLKYDRSDDDWVRVNFVARDIDQDGKTDMIQHIIYRTGTKGNYGHTEKLLVYSNEGPKANYRMKLQDQAVRTFDDFVQGVLYSLPVFLDVDTNLDNPEFAVIENDRIETWKLRRDHRQETRLYRVDNGRSQQRFAYHPFRDGGEGATYQADGRRNYPFFSIRHAPGSKLVRWIVEESNGLQRKRQFKYKGAMTDVRERGFMGFRVLRNTEWYWNNTTRIWNINEYDRTYQQPVVERSWKSTSEQIDDYLSLIRYTYASERVNGIVIRKPTEIETDDRLAGFTATETLAYDQYWNPTRITVEKPGATTTTQYEYSNDGSTSEGNYHFGRLLQERVVSNIDGDQKTLQHDYQYYEESGKDNLTEKKITTYNDTDEIREKLVYDAWGNVVEKTTNADGVKKRTETFAYSPDGRFMTSSTAIDGKKTTYDYDPVSGNPVSSTDHLGQTISTKYDGWGRTTRETDYLGNHTRYRYANDQNGRVRYIVKGADGSESYTVQDAFGTEREQGVKNFNGQFVIVRTDYDGSGRKTRESEPHFASEQPPWNTYAYDTYGRLTTLTAFTGQTMQTTYDGLSTTVTDETKSVTTVKDASGRVVQTTDPGGTVKYTYDAHGHLLKTNYDGHKIRMNYDAMGHKTKLEDPSAGTYRYTHDAFGQLLEEVSPKGTTAYTYDEFGKVLSKKIVGDLTNISEEYTYDPESNQVTQRTGISNQEGYEYTYEYDEYFRLVKTKETNGQASFRHELTYDELGRVATERFRSKLLAGGAHQVSQEHVYGPYGQAVALRSEGVTVWELKEENAKGQILRAVLGNGLQRTTQYDDYGFVKRIKDYRDEESRAAYHSRYAFDPKTGCLLSRKNNTIKGNWSEAFSYDQLNRLTETKGDVTEKRQYDERGRTQENSNLGQYTYASGASYQLAGVNLNANGQQYYQERPLHNVTYNAFKKPMGVHQPGHGRVDYAYNPGMGRSHAYYGNEKSSINERRFHKHYGGVFPGEIVEDRQKNTVKLITYLGGDAYSAPAVSVKQLNSAEEKESSLVYIHRDYLGSIVALTDSEGETIERTHYGAWGTVDYYEHRDGTEFGYESLLQRGYTGHEHFVDIGLIHMNGRMYDPVLSRFLSPDNYVQDPGNTQNYNRYGYAYNNPLMYSDPSGEFFLAAVGLVAGAFGGGAVATVAAAFIVGGTSAVLFNGASNIINGQSFFSGAGSAFIFGGISGVMSLGIGQAFAPGSDFYGSVLHHGAHGLSGGVMAELQGGSFGSGFASGYISHAIAAKTNALTPGMHPVQKELVTLASGTLSGGVSSRIAGGSWVMGLRQGFSSTLLNQIVSEAESLRRAQQRFEEEIPNIIEREMEGLPKEPVSFQIGDRPRRLPGATTEWVRVDTREEFGVRLEPAKPSPPKIPLSGGRISLGATLRAIGGTIVSSVKIFEIKRTYHQISLYQEVNRYPYVENSQWSGLRPTDPTGGFEIRLDRGGSN